MVGHHRHHHRLCRHPHHNHLRIDDEGVLSGDGRTRSANTPLVRKVSNYHAGRDGDYDINHSGDNLLCDIVVCC